MRIDEKIEKYLQQGMFQPPRSFRAKKIISQGDMRIQKGEYVFQKEVHGKYLYQMGFNDTVTLGEFDLKQLLQSRKIEVK